VNCIFNKFLILKFSTIGAVL